MKGRAWIVVLVVMGLTFGAWSACFAQSATPEEIIAKVDEAVQFLAKEKAAGLEEFKDPKGRWAWKDTYIFVLDCEAGVTVAHIVPQVIGKPVAELMDKESNPFGLMICEAGAAPKGEWIEYWWTKPDSGTKTFRKISLCRSVPGTPYVLGAGIYEPEKTLEDLNAGLK